MHPRVREERFWAAADAPPLGKRWALDASNLEAAKRTSFLGAYRVLPGVLFADFRQRGELLRAESVC